MTERRHARRPGGDRATLYREARKALRHGDTAALRALLGRLPADSAKALQLRARIEQTLGRVPAGVSKPSRSVPRPSPVRSDDARAIEGSVAVMSGRPPVDIVLRPDSGEHLFGLRYREGKVMVVIDTAHSAASKILTPGGKAVCEGATFLLRAWAELEFDSAAVDTVHRRVRGMRFDWNRVMSVLVDEE